MQNVFHRAIRAKSAQFSIILSIFGSFLGGILSLSPTAFAASVGLSNEIRGLETKSYLIKWKPGFEFTESLELLGHQIELEKLTLPSWSQFHPPVAPDGFLGSPSDWQSVIINGLRNLEGVDYVQPNFKLKIPEFGGITTKEKDELLKRFLKNRTPEDIVALEKEKDFTDNPPFPKAPLKKRGEDPEFEHQWGMIDIGVKSAWKKSRGGENDMVVAVIDTGVDYTHEDLVGNLWRNQGEVGFDENGNSRETNGIDDDGNGFIDDVLGWDFAYNDNKPYDLSTKSTWKLLTGGNPGHGTHCAGNVGASGNNGIGIAGVAPDVKIMSIRFLTEKGTGTTAAGIQSIVYAVNNGAKVLSNSWGGEGVDDDSNDENRALKEAISYAESKGVLFIAAAGNGRMGRAYDNDNDPKPAYPASYPHENIISVAAITISDRMGSFSNFGATTVDIGAPGVRTFSTVPGDSYSDTVINLLGMKIHWDGTSMATPHVAGAAALYWSQNPEKTWREVKDAILRTAVPIPQLRGKVLTGGKLNVKELMRF